MRETVTVEGRTIEHNTRPWHTLTNRHTTTGGYTWGWIEGAPGNECWSDDSRFDSRAASKMCQLHNQWIEDQTPIMLRIKVQAARKEVARKEYVRRVDAAAKAKAEYMAELEKLGGLFVLAQENE